MTAAPEPEREQVGPYKLIAAIGAGGSARIDLARIDRAYGFQRHVVIKRPLEHLRADRAVAAQLQREARIGGRLRHPNLVAVLDAGTHDDYPYLVLEYVQGSSLRTLMQTPRVMEPSAPAARPEGSVGGRVRELPLAVALGIAIDVARGMHDAHELTDEHGAPLGLVHRDVSPGNILLGSDGTVKLADFGIAKETRVSTLSGSMHGTVTYMAPEQCRGHAFDRRADIFSLGVILYELVTQTRLFWADNDVASLHRVLSGNVPRPRKIKPGLSPVLEEIVLTALAPDPERRFATARQIADAIEGHAAHEGLVLGARRLARAMEQAFGRQHAPWVAARTVVDPPRGDGSLVEIIAAAAPPDEPLLPTFGPSEDGADEAALTPVPQPRRRSRAALAIVIFVAVIAGSFATYLAMSWMSDDKAPEITSRPTPAPPPPVTPPRSEPPPLTTQPAEASLPPAPPTTTTVPTRTSPTRRKTRTAPPVADKAEPAPPVAEPPPAPPVEPKRSTADWDPGKLYPEDFAKKKPQKP